MTGIKYLLKSIGLIFCPAYEGACWAAGHLEGRNWHSEQQLDAALTAAAMPAHLLVNDAALNNGLRAAVTASKGGRRKQKRSGVSAAALPPSKEKSSPPGRSGKSATNSMC